MSLLEQQEEEQEEMLLPLCLTGFCYAEAGKNNDATHLKSTLESLIHVPSSATSFCFFPSKRTLSSPKSPDFATIKNQGKIPGNYCMSKGDFPHLNFF